MDFYSAGFSRKNLKGVLNYVSKQLRKKVYSFAYLYSEKVCKTFFREPAVYNF
jgi:hypothetical protein